MSGNPFEHTGVTMFTLAKMAEARDPSAGAHVERVQAYSRLLAQQLANQGTFYDLIDEQYIQEIYHASALHDIGKIGIPEHVLLKCGELSREEFELVKTHTTIGASILQSALENFPKATFLNMARDIALYHHERFNGGGYPMGLSRNQIPLSARIVAVADVYDVLGSKRVYKAPFDQQMTRAKIIDGAGDQFDPDVVEAFLACEKKFIRVRERFIDTPAVHKRVERDWGKDSLGDARRKNKSFETNVLVEL